MNTTQATPRGEQVLVVGIGADQTAAALAARSVDRVVFYSLEGAIRLRDALGYVGEVVDVTGRVSEVESIAWSWATDLSAHVASHARWLPSDVLETARRGLFLSVFMPIALARFRAEELRPIPGQPRSLRLLGVTTTEQVELERLGLGDAEMQPVANGDAAPSVAPDSLVDVGSSGRAGAIARHIPGLFGREFVEWKRLRHVRADARALRARGDGRPTALVLASVAVHLELFRTPVGELTSRGWRVVVVQLSPGDDLSKEVHALRATSLAFAPFVTCGDTLGRMLRRRATGPRLQRVIDEWSRSMGLDMHAGAIRSGFQAHYESTRQLMEGHRQVLRACRPDVVLTVSEINPPHETVAPVARAFSKPSVNVQHGAITALPRFSDFRFDSFCVFGEAYREALVAVGNRAEQIRVTGNPFMDSLTDSYAPQGDPGSTAPGLDEHGGLAEVTILFAAGYACDTVSDISLYRTLSMVLECLERDPRCRLIVKLHPIGEGKEAGYELALSERPSARVTVVRDASLYDLIKTADCVTTHGSTVAIEAASLRTPTILLSPRDYEDALPVVKEGVALRARDADEFAERLGQLLSGAIIPEEAYQRFDRRFAFTRDGSAGARIADVCEELVGRRA